MNFQRLAEKYSFAIDQVKKIYAEYKKKSLIQHKRHFMIFELDQIQRYWYE